MRPLLLPLALATALLAPATALAAPPSKAEVARYAQTLLDESYRSDGPGAALLIAHGDEVLFRGARGQADLDKHLPLTADGKFEIGSVSKQFAAAGLLKLVEAGKVSLDDPLSKYVKDYPNGEHITVRQLLNHTSGVKSYTGISGYMMGPLIQRDLTTAQLIDVFKNEPVDFAPGTAFSYNNSGYVLVGAVIEAASGQPWYRYLEQALFKPLGLTHTGYGADPAIARQQVHGYSNETGQAAPARQLSMTQPHAAGALVSTVDDLLKWNRALHEGKVLKTASYQQMITPEGKAAEGGTHYGYGIGRATLRGHDQLAHGGGIFGFSSYLTYLPDDDLSIVMLQNTDSEGAHRGTAELAHKLAAVAIGDPYPEAKAIAVDAATLKEVEGVYRIDEKTQRVLRVRDGQLISQRTGGQPFTLTPIAKDSYLFPEGFSRYRVERDAQGRISGLRFFQDGEGEGVVATRTNDPLPAEPIAVELPRAALERIVGNYVGPAPLKVFLDGAALKAQITGQPAFALTAQSANTFAVSAVGATLEFAPADGVVKTVTIHQGGGTTEFQRAGN